MTLVWPMLLALALGGAPAHAFDITTCGQAIPAGEVGDLRSDLVCPTVGVALTTGGTLNLNGHTIVGPGIEISAGVQCSGERRAFCTVNGPGLVTNFFSGFGGLGGSLRLQGVAARGNTSGLMYKGPRLIELVDADMSDNLRYGVVARGGRIRGRNVRATGNGIGGVWGTIEEMVNLTATGNGVHGGVFVVRSDQRRTPRLIDSTITDNNGLGRGFDVLATLRVRLRNSTCGRGARVRVVRRSEGGSMTTVRGRLRCADD